eukprot:scaffold23729_cov120-Isochrysis_galbana.AAC.4
MCTGMYDCPLAPRRLWSSLTCAALRSLNSAAPISSNVPPVTRVPPAAPDASRWPPARPAAASAKAGGTRLRHQRSSKSWLPSKPPKTNECSPSTASAAHARCLGARSQGETRERGACRPAVAVRGASARSCAWLGAWLCAWLCAGL